MYRQFDTLKLAFPTLYAEIINESKFIQDTDNKGKISYLLRTNEKQKIVGLNSLRVGFTETVIEISAKILRKNYPKLLSVDTIEEALWNLHISGLISFDVTDVLRFAHIYKAHPAKHLRLSQSFAAYANPLAQLYTNNEYRLLPYKDETVSFIQNVGTTKHREYFRLYNKMIEYSLSKNAGYRETLTAQQKHSVSVFFQDVVKAETELNSKRKLRQYYPDISPEIWLRDLLLSETDPIAAQFDEITKGLYKAMENKETERGNEFTNLLNYKEQLEFTTLKHYGYDLHRVKAWLKNALSPRTAQRRQREYEALLQRFKAHETDGTAKALLLELRAAISAPTPVFYNYSTVVPKLTYQTETVRASEYKEIEEDYLVW